MKANTRLALCRSAFVCLIGVLSISSSNISYADESESKELRPAILDINIEDIESIGTLSDLKDGGLGRGLWDNSARTDIIELIDIMQPPMQDLPANRNLVWGALRSSTNGDLVTGQFDAETGADIFTARMRKLLEFGAYKDAQNMYSILSHEPYHPNLARLGLLSMLYNSERSVACLEYKIVEDRAFEGDFWENISAYCLHVFQEDGAEEALAAAPSNILKKIAENKGYNITYDKNSFGALSDFDRAVLVADSRLKRPTIGPATAASLPLRDLGIFLYDKSLADSERFFALTRAATYGLVGTEELKSAYQAFYNQSFKGNLQEWQKFIIAYKEIHDAAKGREQWNMFLDAYAKARSYGIGALTPFADKILRFDITDLDKDEVLRAIHVLYQAGVPIPRLWSEKFLEKKNGSFTDADLALIGIISTPSYRFSEEDILALQGVLEKKDEQIQKVLGIIIENLDKNIPDIHNADTIYEKHFDLTFDTDYVMPTLRVWDRLNESGQNGQIGTTVLLSALVLQEWNKGNQYPGYIHSVFENLNSVGLTNVTQSLALGAVMEHIK